MAKTDWESFVTSTLHKLIVMEAEEKDIANKKIIKKFYYKLKMLSMLKLILKNIK